MIDLASIVGALVSIISTIFWHWLKNLEHREELQEASVKLLQDKTAQIELKISEVYTTKREFERAVDQIKYEMAEIRESILRVETKLDQMRV